MTKDFIHKISAKKQTTIVEPKVEKKITKKVKTITKTESLLKS